MVMDVYCLLHGAAKITGYIEIKNKFQAVLQT
jgi:hypothetical protein